MSVNLKVSLGTVNYTDFLHVSAAKVSAPSAVVWEDWFDVPVTNYNFIIPNLDPENYIVSYYDAATEGSLGTLVMQLIVNALSGQVISERIFYTTGGPKSTDPADGASEIIDPYLIGKNVSGCFREGFRYLEKEEEFTFDDGIGKIIIAGSSLAKDEKFIAEITYEGGQSTSTGGSGGGLYENTLTVAEATRILLASEVNSRVRCAGTAATQVLTLPPLAGFAAGSGFYFDNTVGGTAIQVKLLLPGTDRIRFNGFMTSSDLFAEFWVSKGEHLDLKKFDDNYWEVISDYKGTNVGERLSAQYAYHPGTLTENGQLIDGDVYPRLWWFIKNILPPTHYFTDDNVESSGWTPVEARFGQFSVHSTLKKFRMPVSWLMSEKGLQNNLTYGIDSTRPVDYPGGFQGEAIGAHTHDGIYGDTASHGSSSTALVGIWKWLVGLSNTGNGQVQNGKTGNVTGVPKDNTVKNIGVVYARRI